MASFFSDEEDDDEDGSPSGVDTAAAIYSTQVSSDEELEPAVEVSVSPELHAGQHRATGTLQDDELESANRDNREVLERANRALQAQVDSLSAEVQRLSQQNEALQEQLERSEKSQNQEQQKLEASLDEERARYECTVHEWLRMEREDERAALQREVLQQVHAARSIISEQGSELIHRSERLADENARLEKQVRRQVVEREQHQSVAAELREASAHQGHELPTASVQAKVSESERLVAELRSELRQEISVAENSQHEAQRLRLQHAARVNGLEGTGKAVSNGLFEAHSPQLASMAHELRCVHAEVAEVRIGQRAAQESVAVHMESKAGELEQQQMLRLCGCLEAHIATLDEELSARATSRQLGQKVALPTDLDGIAKKFRSEHSGFLQRFAHLKEDLRSAESGCASRQALTPSPLKQLAPNALTARAGCTNGAHNGDHEMLDSGHAASEAVPSSRPGLAVDGHDRLPNLARDSATVVGALLRTIKGLSESSESSRGHEAVADISLQASAALERHTQKLERSNHEWASLLVERGLASHEWAARLAEKAEAGPPPPAQLHDVEIQLGKLSGRLQGLNSPALAALSVRT